MRIIILVIVFCTCLSTIIGCKIKTNDRDFEEYAITLMDSTLKYYTSDEFGLFYETYPNSEKAFTTFVDVIDSIHNNRIAFMWSITGVFSAVNSLISLTGSNKYKSFLDDFILTGIKKYYDTIRVPHAYQSYILDAGKSDRFYDDNLWLGINFIENYKLTGNVELLNLSIQAWNFIETGLDSILGGGIYWCEQTKSSKNVCSNAPAAVLALKLYETTNDARYLKAAKEIYKWTKCNLQDTVDNLYFDNISLNGLINKTKFQYNSGQMLQAAVLLYKATNNKQYLYEAKELAIACDNYFFREYINNNRKKFRVLKDGNIWFIAVMLRGFEELYKVDKNRFYIDNFRNTLQEVWSKNPNHNKLFDDKFFIEKSDNKKDTKWLLTQVAMVDMYSRLANINKEIQ